MLTTLLVAICGLLHAGPGPAAAKALLTPLRGDYVEVRTASVFAGPCHFNGELMTTGQDAICAWNIQSGSWKGIDLSGVRVMAEISASVNLSQADAVRQSELIVDRSATPAQVAAVADAIRSHYAAALGSVQSTRTASIHFAHVQKAYEVSAEGFARLSVQAMPNDECCKQPNLVWYKPLVPLIGRKVGYTVSASYASGTVTDPWDRSEENSAFYGAFAF